MVLLNLKVSLFLSFSLSSLAFVSSFHSLLLYIDGSVGLKTHFSLSFFSHVFGCQKEGLDIHSIAKNPKKKKRLVL